MIKNPAYSYVKFRNPDLNKFTTNYRLLLMSARAAGYLILIIAFVCSFGASAQVTSSFKANDTAGCAPFVVSFTNTSTNATSYFWDLGNGSNSSLTDVSGVYTTAGSYTVTLTSTGPGGSKTSATVIRIYDPPTVNFSANKTGVCPGSPIAFTSTSTANCWGTLDYVWNFGEGGSSSATSPSYSYLAPGNFNVTLFATNKAGCFSSFKRSGYIYVYDLPAIAFKAAITSYCKAPVPVSFVNTSTGSGSLTYTWSFGDGGTSASTSPTHTYTMPGSSPDVKLKVKDSNGCTDSLEKADYISIGSLSAGFSGSLRPCLFINDTFKNTSSPHTSSQWYFGDGSTSTDEDGIHAYTSTGTYTVKLVVYDGTCYDSITRVVTVAKPGGSFTMTRGMCPLPAPMTFTASVPAGATVAWRSLIYGSFGAGSPFTYTFPNHKDASDERGTIDAITMYVTDINGCRDTIGPLKDTINGPRVDITGAPFTSGCVPFTVKYNAKVISSVYSPFGYFPPRNLVLFPYPYGVISYKWDFADGSPVSTLPAPTHVFTAPGTYAVKLTVVNANGCTVSNIDTVKVGATPPVASFTRFPSRLCAGVPASFTSTSTGTINEYTWDFGEGEFSKDANPTHVYRIPGVHTAILKVFNNGCASAEFRLNDTIDAPGAFIGYKLNCIPRNGVSFADSSIGDDTHLWTFGDGFTSTADHPVHFYPAVGSYVVKLSTYNATSGCRDSISKRILLQRPTISLVSPRPIVCPNSPPNTVLDTIKNVMDGLSPFTSVVNSYWYVNGAGVGPSVPYYTNPVSSSVMADSFLYPFRVRGTNVVTTIFTDNHGCLDTAKINIMVAKPIGNFSITPASGCAPLPVSFKDLSTDVPGVVLTKYLWSFGDGAVTTSTTSPVIHVYTASGTYTAKEIVTDNIGCADTFTSSLTPSISKPKAGFTTNTTATCVGFNVSFNNTSVGSASYLWNFGDGGTSTLPIPVHIYTAAGVYTVRLVAINGLGCKDTATQTAAVTVSALPKASFFMDDSFAVCPPLNVNFTNTSTGGTYYRWTLGDGTNSIIAAPGNIYTAPGRYRIKLVVVNTAGCIDTAVAYASIFGYSGAFTYTPLTACSSAPVYFKSLLSGVANMLWDFNDGYISGASIKDTISHRYTAVGAYLPRLILTDSSGCTSISTGADTIRIDTLVPGFSITPNPACQNSIVNFADSSISYSTPGTAWLWTFGTGATSTLRSPTYSYSVAGTKLVSLTVTNDAGCKGTAIKSVYVDPLPPDITGAGSICAGEQLALSNATGGGTWTSNNTLVAVVDAVSGIVSGLSAGTATVVYELPTGCRVSTTVTINATPAPISGSATICEGFTSTFSDITSGGTWSSSNTAIVKVGLSTGVVTGIMADTARIFYELATGCKVSRVVSVDPSPSPIVGAPSVCEGSVMVLSNAIAGGSWISSNTTIATIGSSSGVVTGVSAGVISVVYALFSGCTVSKGITVTAPIMPITGPPNVCIGSTVTLSNATPGFGGTWASSNTTIAITTLGTGKVTGIAAGTATISYTTLAGCIVTEIITVDTIPSPILGAASLCQGTTATLSNAGAGGTWSTAATIIALDAGTGAIAGIAAGTAAVTYTIASGCKTTRNVTVNIAPAPIAGIRDICNGLTIALSNTVRPGVWSSGNTAVATIGSGSGIVTGIIPGTASVTYTLNSTGCMVTDTLTVIGLKSLITGIREVCEGGITGLSDTGTGTWASGNTAIAVIGKATGLITGITAGTTLITYTGSTGCFTVLTVTVNPKPAPITGIAKVCAGVPANFSTTTADGTWSSNRTAVATIGVNTGDITTLSAGTATISYVLPTGCFALRTITVDPVPLPITGALEVCVAAAISLSDPDVGGVWSSSNPAIAVIGSGTGIVTGVSDGVDTITYRFSTGCSTITTVTVHPLPSGITGDTHVCTGDTAFVSDATPGGQWSSSNTAMATIGISDGVVAGILPGVIDISYTLATGCMAATTFTVNPTPPAITGTTNLCKAGSTRIFNVVGGGVWTTSNALVATIDGTGLVAGISAGTASITYTAEGNCTAQTTVTVYPLLTAISGPVQLCLGSEGVLSNGIPGGQWGSSNTSVAPVDVSGKVTALSVGTATISYTLVNSCGEAELTLSVMPLPFAGTLSGDTTICTGATSVLNNAVAGGVWMSSNTVVALVDATGSVTGVKPGKSNIEYTYTNACGTDKTQLTVIINQLPDPARIVTRPDTVMCAGTLFQNFGADAPQPPGGHFFWSADNAVIYAVSSDRQYILVSFNATGTSVVRLSSLFSSSECASIDSVVVHVGSDASPQPVVVYYAPEFVCKDNTADSYQWGYDDVHTLDSTLFENGRNMNFHERQPDFANRNYWVITSHNGCLQKSYYNRPAGTSAETIAENMAIELYPNPADNNVNIEVKGINGQGTLNFKLYDVAGKERAAGMLNNGKGSVDLSAAVPGVYMVLITKDKIKVGAKVFVKR